MTGHAAANAMNAMNEWMQWTNAMNEWINQYFKCVSADLGMWKEPLSLQ